MTIQEDLIDVAANTKLTQDELAKAYGISRVQFNKYVKGHSKKPRGEVLERMVKTTAMLRQLVASLKLPLPDTHTKEKRLAAMEKVRLFVQNTPSA